MSFYSILPSLLGSGVALVGIGVAYASLSANRGLNRAKFLYDLHRDFFVAETYKNALDALDEPAGASGIAALVQNESYELIQLLNAFELVAYFVVKTDQLETSDANALLGYYLGCIPRHPKLQQYIKDNSFEYLNDLLSTKL